jgi:hypothetical protein
VRTLIRGWKRKKGRDQRQHRQRCGSLLLAILVHGTINTFSLYIGQLFPAQAESQINGLIGFGFTALLIVMVTRGRLGYTANEEASRLTWRRMVTRSLQRHARVVLFCLVLGNGLSVSASEVTLERVQAALPHLERRAEETIQKNGVPGMAIAVVYKDHEFSFRKKRARIVHRAAAGTSRPPPVVPDAVLARQCLFHPPR